MQIIVVKRIEYVTVIDSKNEAEATLKASKRPWWLWRKSWNEFSFVPPKELLNEEYEGLTIKEYAAKNLETSRKPVGESHIYHKW